MRRRQQSGSTKPAGARRRLADYRAKRDFSATPEPSGAGARSRSQSLREPLPFVIQKHAASRLHYDFRLGWDGVLKSWAVARGPSYFPGDRRLAVEVEDHPLAYGDFEGIIPKGQYGGGTVMLWDRGTWEPRGDAAEGFRKGNLKFALHGEKLHGNWALIRMHGRLENAAKPNWLLIKEHDGEERGADDKSITDEATDSVLSGRTMEAIASARDRVWNSNGGGSSQGSSAQPARRRSRAAKKDTPEGPPAPSPAKNLFGAGKEKLPGFIPPQLASMVKSAPRGEAWLHELKLDGYRIQARLNRTGRTASVQLLTRTGLNWTLRMTGIADAVAALPARTALFDGEVVVLAPDGTTSFAALQAAFQLGAKRPLSYFVFDLLHLDGRNLRGLPLIHRKEILFELFADVHNGSPFHLSQHTFGDGREVFARACNLGAEGIVSKLSQSKYSSGRTSAWVKLKCYREQELVIGGFTLPSNGIHGVGALLLGYYRDGKLVYAGRTGTGFTQETHRRMRERLDSLRQVKPPFATLPSDAARQAIWVRPELVAQVAFTAWTTDDLVRQAAFKGLREDKPAKEVRREVENRRMIEVKQTPRQAKVTAAPRRATPVVRSPRSSGTRTPESAGPLPIRLTHPDKVLDEQTGLTKDALAHYFVAVADAMLPHVAGRPLTLVRCLNGNGKSCFYQKHASASLPKEIGSIGVVDRKTGRPEPYITLSTSAGLAALAQLDVLELHPWGSKNNSLEKPDRIVFDLDPDAAIDWATLADAAKQVRRRLKSHSLDSFLKSTGGKGLHVVAPIEPEQQWPAVKEFAHNIVLAMEKETPSLYLTRMTKADRKGKIYLDYLRNERGATSVAPWSPRARAGAPVAIPLSWRELGAREAPRFLVADFSHWKRRLTTDPWKNMWSVRQRIPASDST